MNIIFILHYFKYSFIVNLILTIVSYRSSRALCWRISTKVLKFLKL